MKHVAPSILLAASLLAGCSTEPPIAKGESVRALVRAQTHDAEATARNGTTTREGPDPERAAAAVRAMREGIAKPKEDWQTVITSGSGRIEE